MQFIQETFVLFQSAHILGGLISFIFISSLRGIIACYYLRLERKFESKQPHKSKCWLKYYMHTHTQLCVVGFGTSIEPSENIPHY